jgi:hypothetical protein
MDCYSTSDQRKALLELAEALGSRKAALHRDQCDDWRIAPASTPAITPTRPAAAPVRTRSILVSPSGAIERARTPTIQFS